MADIKLASAGDDIKLWECGGFSLIKQFNPHTNQNVSSLCWSHDNTNLASASVGGDKISLTYLEDTSAAAYSFDVASGGVPWAEFPTVPLGEDSRTCLAFNSNSRYIAGGGPDGIIHLWDLKTQKLKKSYRDHKGPLTTVQFNWNDTDIASGSESGEIIIYNVISGQGSSPLIGPRTQAVRQLQYSHFKKSVLGSVSEDGAVNLWDTNRRSLIHSFSDIHKAPATGIAFSPRNEMLMMSVGLDKRIICYDVQGKNAVKTMMAESPLTSIDLMYDGATLAVGSTRGKVFVYDLRQGHSPVRTMTAHKSSVQALAFQDNNKAKAEVGGIPTRMGSSRKVNANNNMAQSSRAASRKPVNVANGVDTHADPNSAAARGGGLDRTNNNRLDAVNSNKANLEYNPVFSPIRDRIVVPRWNSKSTPKGDRISYIRATYTSAGSRSADSSPSEVHTEPAGTGALAAGENSLEKYGDGFFSPLLGDSGSLSARSQKLTSTLSEASPAKTRVTSTLSHSGDQLKQDTHSSIPTVHGSMEFTSTQSKFSGSRIPAAGSLSMSPRASATRDPADFQHGQSEMSMSPRASATRDPADFQHSQSEKAIGQRGDDRGPRSRSSPPSRITQHTPDDAGATNVMDHRRVSTSPDVSTPPDATAAQGADSCVSRYSPRSGRSGATTGQGGHSVVGFQMDMVRSMVNEALEGFRDQVRRDILNLHMDVLKQFQIQQSEIRHLLQQYSVNEELMAEIGRLREENETLKKKF